MLGGPIIAGATLTRFFALHVFVIPGTLLCFTALHVWMVLKLGINEWPMPGRIVRRETYMQEYNELTHKDGIPFVPDAVWKDLIFSAAILFAVAFCAAVFGPYGPTGVPDPTIIQTVPKPDFFFLWIYTVLSYLPPSMETPFILIVPAVAVAILLALPFVAGVGEKSWWRRPVAVFARDVHRGVLWRVHASGHVRRRGVRTWMRGAERRFRCSICTTARRWSGRARIVFQEKQCRNCHALGGVGGQRGPALGDVATRLTEDQMIRQVLLGGGNMPAYGSTLSPAETTALVRFLDTLHPNYQPAASDASRQVVQTGGIPPKSTVEHGGGQQNPH